MAVDSAILSILPQVTNVASSSDASAGPLELAGVNVDFRGTERIDRSWIASSYAPSRGPVARDGKREVRPIVETPSARLVMQDYTLMLGQSRVWLVRCAKLHSLRLQKLLACLIHTMQLTAWCCATTAAVQCLPYLVFRMSFQHLQRHAVSHLLPRRRNTDIASMTRWMQCACRHSPFL